MLKAITTLLVFQLAGEILAQFAGLPLPGPVLGMALLMLALLGFGRTPDWLNETADVLLRHFSLLFVPASVGLMQYLSRIEAEWLPIVVTLIVSTVISIAASALTFVAVAKLVGAAPRDDERKAAP
nr:CidA/LrgA family protein [uncultured Dongia sp.]